MAIWQFNIAFLPQSWISSCGNLEYLFGPEGFDPALAWQRYNHSQFEAVLSGALSSGKSWRADLTLWGNAETDYIQLWRTKGNVKAIQVGFDLRKPNMALFRAVVEIARELELVFLVLDTKCVVPLDVQRLLRAAAESEAAHFSLDPASFLLQVEPANARAT